MVSTNGRARTQPKLVLVMPRVPILRRASSAAPTDLRTDATRYASIQSSETTQRTDSFRDAPRGASGVNSAPISPPPPCLPVQNDYLAHNPYLSEGHFDFFCFQVRFSVSIERNSSSASAVSCPPAPTTPAPAKFESHKGSDFSLFRPNSKIEEKKSKSNTKAQDQRPKFLMRRVRI